MLHKKEPHLNLIPNKEKEKPIPSKETQDKKIVEFIRKVQDSQNVENWKVFNHPITESPYFVSFQIKNLIKKYGYEFLDRIKLTTPQKEIFATIIGEYNDKLYIHVDKNGKAEPLVNYVDQNFKVIKTDSTETQFESKKKFKHLYLRRYIHIHDRYERETAYFNKFKPKLPNFLFFTARLNQNEKYLTIAKLQLRTADKTKNPLHLPYLPIENLDDICSKNEDVKVRMGLKK